MPRTLKDAGVRERYGIGEWYGRSFVSLSAEERIDYAATSSPGAHPCLPRSTDENPVPCSKRGGVCSLRLYRQGQGFSDNVIPLDAGSLVTLCPHRLKERGKIFAWVGENILADRLPQIVTEVGFLIREHPELYSPDEAGPGIAASQDEGEVTDDHEDVGQIDYVLLRDKSGLLNWCALELQAVYFSGAKISDEYATIRATPDREIPFPQRNRRPDYRSSGPKRLMPQLQIKVPTLRRWGKKMAVVVDRNFFNSLGAMEPVLDISNCDIVWCVVKYAETDGEISLVFDSINYTTLERAVEGLTAGKPVTLSNFESRVKEKLNRPLKKKRKQAATTK